MIDYMVGKFGIERGRICMVGDRLDTDILFGQNNGYVKRFSLERVAPLPTLQHPEPPVTPLPLTLRSPSDMPLFLTPCPPLWYLKRFSLERVAPLPMLQQVALGMHLARKPWLVRKGLFHIPPQVSLSRPPQASLLPDAVGSHHKGEAHLDRE
jgi:hypothetical protein